MAPDLEPGVERRLASPEDGAEVHLVVGVEEASQEEREQLEAAGGTVHDELPLDHYSVTISEENLERLCDLDAVTSVDIDTEGPVFGSDFPSPW